MVEFSDPLTRFTEIVTRLHRMEYRGEEQVPRVSGGYHSLGGALCFLLGRQTNAEEYSRFEAIEDFTHMLQLSIEAERYVQEHSPPRAKERNMEHVRAITDRLSSLSANAAAENMNGNNFGAVHIERLTALADNLSAYAQDRMVSAEEIKEIIGLIDQLTDYILESRIDDRLRDALVQTLGRLRMELQRVNIIGPGAVADNVDRLLGQAVRAAITPGSSEQHEQGVEVFERSVKVAEGIGKVVDTGQKLWPVLEAGAKAFGILPQ